MFYGREHQKKSLLDMMAKDEQMISLIYGRRRIGKSELIKQSLRETNVPSIYYECKQTTEQNNVDSLAEIIGDSFHFPKPSFRSMEEVLNFLFEKADFRFRRRLCQSAGRHSIADLFFLSDLLFCACWKF